MEFDQRFFYAFILFVHGIGHMVGVIHISEIYKLPGFENESWLFSERFGLSGSQSKSLVVLWLIATVGFVIAAWGFWTEASWWKVSVISLTPFSVLLFIFWWTAFPPNLPIQANIGNVIAIFGLFWFK